jgi:hypothetical protein
MEYLYTYTPIVSRWGSRSDFQKSNVALAMNLIFNPIPDVLYWQDVDHLFFMLNAHPEVALQ